MLVGMEGSPPPQPGALDTERGPAPKAPGITRVLAVALALIVAFGAAVMIVAMNDIRTTPTCADVRSGKAAVPGDRKCFDGSGTKKSIVLGLGWTGGVLGALAALGAVGFAIVGRRGWLLVAAIGAAVALSALSILIGST